MRILGIDVGLAGGLVLLHNGKIDHKCIMPVIEVKKANGTKREYNIPAIAAILRHLQPEHVMIEKQQAMPAQGSVSMFSIGLGYGILRGLVTGLNLPHTIVVAQSWQKIMFEGCAKNDTKAVAAIICGRLWPDADWRASDRCKKAHDGMCDAGLIAEYGRRIFGSNV